MINSYSDMAGSPMDPMDHEADSGFNQGYNPGRAGTQVADVQNLHPPGTFARNTQGGDIINGMAKQLGIKNPSNVIKFPKK